uniref:Chromosome 1 open reading frame 74 n=1 Tax=Anas platyrhynchos TaxID=8839 RepID=A0A8B9T9T4_ANAPL
SLWLQLKSSRPLPAPQLVAAAREALGAGSGRRRRRLPASRALHLAGEVLAVAAGLKPALLYDCGAEGPAELRRYLERLREAGLAPHRLHLLAAGGSALLLHPGGARRRLEAALRARPGPFVDVAAARGSPQLCGPAQAQAIRGPPRRLAARSSPPGWNLCTVFGEGGENCLALRPLRVFTVRARCPRIQDGLGVQIYSFSIPESLREELREVLDAWCDDLRDSFRAQSDFVDLCISSEVVSLPAVAL